MTPGICSRCGYPFSECRCENNISKTELENMIIDAVKRKSVPMLNEKDALEKAKTELEKENADLKISAAAKEAAQAAKEEAEQRPTFVDYAEKLEEQREILDHSHDPIRPLNTRKKISESKDPGAGKEYDKWKE